MVEEKEKIRSGLSLWRGGEGEEWRGNDDGRCVVCNFCAELRRSLLMLFVGKCGSAEAPVCGLIIGRCRSDHP